jgi:hypothetical protein
MFNGNDFPSLNRGNRLAAEELAAAREVYVPDYVPVTSIQLNLQDAMLEQYNRARKLLHDSEYDTGIPLNQRAQALNSTTSIIAAITKSQTELFSVERIKQMEESLLEVLQEFPELQAAFLVKYEAALKKIGLDS